MQGNWGILVLLAAAVILYALIQAHKKPEDEDGEDAGAEEDEPGGKPEAAPPEPENGEVPWAEVQRQLAEMPPLSECDQVQFEVPEADAPSNEDHPAPICAGDAEPGPEREGDPGPVGEGKPGPERECEVDPVPESGHPINMGIRREAWRLFCRNYRKILPLAAITMALWLTKLLLQTEGLFSDQLAQGISMMGAPVFLFALFLTLGFAYATFQTWKGDEPRPGMLIFFLQERRFFPALGLVVLEALVLVTPSIVIMIHLLAIQWIAVNVFPEYFYKIMSGLSVAMPVVFVLFLALIVLASGCFCTGIFAFSRAPERGAIRAFKAGFHTNLRNPRRVIGMLVATSWPFAIAYVIWIPTYMWAAAQKSPVLTTVVQLPSLILALIYGGYVFLSMAGLSDLLLSGEDALPERGLATGSGGNAAGSGPDAGGEAGEAVPNDGTNPAEDADAPEPLKDGGESTGY